MSSKQYAYIFTTLYVLLLILLFLYLRISPRPREQSEDVIYVELLEMEEPVKKPKSRPRVAPRHENASRRDNDRQVTGKDENTQTVNNKALFQMTKDGSDKEVNGGNNSAQESDSQKNKGKGDGKKAFGNSQLDEGLQGRGLVGALPKPGAPKGNKEGVVKIRVRVRKDGTVSSAEYHPIGSSTSDEELVRLAISAARRTRFTESSAVSLGGVITYRFVLK
jgi:TonB family protein